MRLLVDECVGSVVADWLKSRGHEVFSVYDERRGMDDDDIIAKAFDENWLLLTSDKDFGEKCIESGAPIGALSFCGWMMNARRTKFVSSISCCNGMRIGCTMSLLS